MTSEQSTETTTAVLLAAADEALIEAGFKTGEFGRAARLVEAAARQAGQDGDAAGAAAAANLQGYLLHYRSITTLMSGGQPEPADTELERAAFARALAGYEKLGDEAGIAGAEFGLGLYEQVLRQDWDAAMVHYRRSESLIPALEAAGDLYTRSEIHRHLGFYHLVEDKHLGTAVQHLQISLDLREEQGEPCRIPSGLLALGWAERENGNPRRAVLLLRRAVELAHAEGLLPARIADAQHELEAAEAALRAQQEQERPEHA
jgi:tetratricopeptide (TPR) repeat protein